MGSTRPLLNLDVKEFLVKLVKPLSITFSPLGNLYLAVPLDLSVIDIIFIPLSLVTTLSTISFVIALIPPSICEVLRFSSYIYYG